MRVKFGSNWLECGPGAPLMVELSDADRRNIANMAPDATKYAVFDDADATSAEDKLAWMGEEPKPQPATEFFCPRGAGPDSPFKAPMNGEAHWRGDATCSYCGSLSPDAFFAAVEAGAEVVPTDKSCKAYVRGGGLQGQPKFYFQHLDVAGQSKFIDLVNTKRMTLAAPGHFYSRPFFCAPAKAG